MDHSRVIDGMKHIKIPEFRVMTCDEHWWTSTNPSYFWAVPQKKIIKNPCPVAPHICSLGGFGRRQARRFQLRLLLRQACKVCQLRWRHPNSWMISWKIHQKKEFGDAPMTEETSMWMGMEHHATASSARIWGDVCDEKLGICDRNHGTIHPDYGIITIIHHGGIIH